MRLMVQWRRVPGKKSEGMDGQAGELPKGGSGLDKCICLAYTYLVKTDPLNAEGFDWDDANLLKIWEKHRVSAAECEQVFFNSPLVTGTDEKHSGKENRYFVLGQTDTGRRLFIVFTLRTGLIRVISARDMSRREREVFESHEDEEASS